MKRGNNDTDSKIKVLIRCRPLSAKEVKLGHKSCISTDCGAKTLSVSKMGKENAVLSSSKGMMHKYGFNDVFGVDFKQENVYNGEISKTIRDCCVNGINSTIFAYGATGSGKTYTMMGNLGVSRRYGVIPRTVQDMFSLCSNHVIQMSYLEVYNEKVQDLLSQSKRPKRLIPCEDPYDKSIKILGLTENVVQSYDEVIEFLHKGSHLRKTNSTAVNEHSSRSHAILTFAIYSRKTRIRTKLSLIDLAGSERASKTMTSGKALREGANINKSLLALSNCITALSKNGTGNINYRDSKLTHILKSSFVGNCKVIMLVCIHPSNFCYDETQNTLKYASRANKIEISFSTSAPLNSVPILKEKTTQQTKKREIEASSKQLCIINKKVQYAEHGSARITVEVLADIAARALLKLEKSEGSRIVSLGESYAKQLTSSSTKSEKVKLKVRTVLEHAMKRNLKKSRLPSIVEVPPPLKEKVELNTLKARLVKPSREKENIPSTNSERVVETKKRRKMKQSLTAKELDKLLKKRIDTPAKPTNKQARIEELLNNFERETRNDDFSNQKQNQYSLITNIYKDFNMKDMVTKDNGTVLRKRKKLFPDSARSASRKLKSKTIGFLSRR